MDILEIKLDLIQWLASIEDPKLVKKLLAFRKKETGNGHVPELKPMTKEELVARALESEKDIREGNIVPIEELEKEYGIK
ncbi:MAG TPA: hypothetical protein ENJ95_03030 [Bacteroidetes bacterium]|nr:hypothetical protein [Bacteroidota bacterium]